MTENASTGLSRREMLHTTAGVAAVSALAGVAIPAVHAADNNTIQVALVGCGGRGTGAAENALRTKAQGPIKLVAMADVFPARLEGSYKSLAREFADQMDVPKDRQFIDFDAHKKAMDCLKAGDVVILTTPPAFRWPMFSYAISKGLNVFMEKPVTVDGPSSRKMLKLGEDSVAKKLKVGVGLMCRHCDARHELYQRIKDGEIGEITLLQAYRMAGVTAMEFSGPKPADITELLYQIKRFHSFLWASGGSFSDFLIHNIDECCWMKDAWPVQAKASGGRHYRGENIDQNFDSYSVEYTFADGTKFMLNGRSVNGAHGEFASYAHGTKGCAVISAHGHSPARCRTYKGHNFTQPNLLWQFKTKEPNPYQLEWDHLITAIRTDKPHNEVKRGVEASVVTAMGRLAAHTGQVVTFDEMLNHKIELAPDVDKFTMASPAPVQARDGKYPVPQPGIKTDREY